MITYEDIKKANDTIKTTTITRKDKKTGEIISKEYAEVNQRIKAFRMVYPNGYIHTHFYDLKEGVCTMLAEVGYYSESGQKVELGTGTASEKETSSFINQTSYIENCETSAVGRALGMAGFGIDTSVASLEEVQNAMANQTEEKAEPKTDRKASPKQIEFLLSKYEGENLEKLLKANNITKIEDLSMATASNLISKLKGAKA